MAFHWIKKKPSLKHCSKATSNWFCFTNGQYFYQIYVRHLQSTEKYSLVTNSLHKRKLWENAQEYKILLKLNWRRLITLVRDTLTINPLLTTSSVLHCTSWGFKRALKYRTWKLVLLWAIVKTFLTSIRPFMLWFEFMIMITIQFLTTVRIIFLFHYCS